MKNRIFAMVALVALVTIATVPAFAETVWKETEISKSCPMPSGLKSPPKIIPPDPNLPPEVAAFSGRWEGIWKNGSKLVLVVERIDAKNAWIIYSWCSPKGSSNYDRYKADMVMEGSQYCMKFHIAWAAMGHASGSVSNFTFKFDPSSLTLKGTDRGATVTLNKISMD